jgi:hypothetical protein
LARTAGIYDLAPGELLPAEKDRLLNVLVNGNGVAALKASRRTLTHVPKAALVRMTLRGIDPKWPRFLLAYFHYVSLLRLVHMIVSKSLALCAVVLASCSGCGIPPPTVEETNKRNEKVEKAARERQDAGIRRAENEIWMETMKTSRFIRVRSYCASSPETLASLYDLLKNQDSERASAFADLTGTDVVEPKTRILVLNLRPIYHGIGANLVRLNRTGRACYVPNESLSN